MFIIQLTYLVPLSRIDELVEEHKEFLRKYYSLGNFLMSGPRIPREGGIILARANGLEEMKEILAEDSFWREGAARYDIIEFNPNQHNRDLSTILEEKLGN
ncbi:GTP cyclohydrolase [Paenibacillus frigoriresistens]|uniref:YciI family protein n=1 Tax=Paenibacillus alginolyticus TaxID=59839 RepID=UPI0015670B26|nr:YciI family protein [Paenibacillus frigoriresistens]NRF94381.1 GTP cyclohydrolase [Paenibacillus frigoriresistens]